MTLLRLTLLTFLMLGMPHMARALVVKTVEINCGEGVSCGLQKARFTGLADTYRNVTHLRQTLKLLASRGGVRDFAWEISGPNGQSILKISYQPKLPVTEVKVKTSSDALKDYVERNTHLHVDAWSDDSLFFEEEMRLRQAISSKGFPRAKIDITSSIVEEGARILIKIDPGSPQRLQGIVVKADSRVAKHFAEMKFNEILGRPFDVQLARVRADELEAELFEFGYYLAAVTLTPRPDGENAVLEVNLTGTELYTFDLRKPPEDVKIEFGPIVKELFRRYRRPLDPPGLQLGIQEVLQKRGFLKPSIEVRQKRFLNNRGEVVNTFYLEMDPGIRTRVRKVSFTGANYWTETKLLSMWRDQAQELATAGFYDEDSNNAFSEWLRGQYIRHGYVRAEIAKPQATFISPGEAVIEYNIAEGPHVLVDDIAVTGLDDNETDEMLEAIATKQGSPFNPFQFAEDVKTITDLFQNKGYFYAEVVNRDADDIVIYGKDRASVRLNIRIRKGKYIEFNRLIIVGNKRTRDKVIKRKLLMKHAEPLTPAKAKEFETTLSSMGLFNTVRVRPINHKGDTPLTDLAAEVTERDYGSVELAPGYRTDIGMKLSGTVSYMNLLGANRSLSFTGQVNQRLDLKTLDDRRRAEGKRMIEYNLGVLYNQPDIFDTYVDYGAGANFQRRRFYQFDADILRISNTLNRDFGGRYTVSLRHQFERINQFDATEVRDNGSFTIGALTPSFTADFRNTRINPTSGAWFNVSNEYANPYFLSQSNTDLVINFYKFVSRNRFYLPIPHGTVALSLVGGIEENLATQYEKDSSGNPIYENGVRKTKGAIPNIKIFRLTGTDIVRGFTDYELNRLPDGSDVGTDPIQKRAYMAIMKLEPRYFINDTLMTGVFFDAGRVYKDTVDLSDIRQSAGVTFKVITPVGTLDFDYGHKLDRKRQPDGKMEAPGRFHISIGFF